MEATENNGKQRETREIMRKHNLCNYVIGNNEKQRETTEDTGNHAKTQCI